MPWYLTLALAILAPPVITLAGVVALYWIAGSGHKIKWRKEKRK